MTDAIIAIEGKSNTLYLYKATDSHPHGMRASLYPSINEIARDKRNASPAKLANLLMMTGEYVISDSPIDARFHYAFNIDTLTLEVQGLKDGQWSDMFTKEFRIPEKYLYIDTNDGTHHVITDADLTFSADKWNLDETDVENIEKLKKYGDTHWEDGWRVVKIKS